MLVESKHVRLPIPEEWFQRSLAETIVWCTRSPLQVDAQEDAETLRRRHLGQKAGELYRRAYLSDSPELVKKYHYRRASRLSARARLHEIAPLHAQLRSSALEPQSFYPSPKEEKCRKIVQGVIDRRSTELSKEILCPSTGTSDLADGRLLLFCTTETLSDGAARYSSKGFFDIDNSPPWDTWVGFMDGYVVSWVPPQLTELANAGVEVNPEQCILWA